MVEISKVNKNVHKFLRYEMTDFFENYKQEFGESIFEQTQFLVFASINGKEPKPENRELFNELVECYNHVPEYKEIVDATLKHLGEVYKNQTIDLGAKTADGATYFKDVKEQLESGDFSFDHLGKPKTEEEEM